MLKLIFTLLLISSISFSENLKDVYTFNFPSTGYPPYMMWTAKKVPYGIFYDVIMAFKEKKDVDFKIVSTPRKRVNLYIDDGKLDITARAKEWTKNPHHYLFTDPIVFTQDVLFMSAENIFPFKDVVDLLGKKVATHPGYKYPLFDIAFKNNKIKRVDVKQNLAKLQMVLSGRVDAVLMNKIVGQWVIAENEFNGRVVQFSLPEKPVGYGLMLNKKNRKFVVEFNKFLKEFKKSGKFEKILKKYR